jgi:hypothetical protein
MVFLLQHTCLLKLVKGLVNSLLNICNGVQFVDRSVDECGNWDGNVGIDSGDVVESVRKNASLLPAVLNSCCINHMSGSIGKLHCLKLVNLVYIQMDDSLIVVVKCV